MYALSQGDNPEFIGMLEEILLDMNASNYQVILAGDWNVYLDPDIDCMGYRDNYKTVMRERLIEFMSTWQQVDIWRIHKPDSERYTWRRINPLQQSRLDQILCS